MKNKLDIRRLAIVIFVLAVFSANLLSSSYAKFVSVLENSTYNRVVGFNVTGGTTPEQEVLNANVVLAPEETESFYATINYFSQVNTEFSVVGHYTSGYGVLADFDALKTTYATYLVSECGYTSAEAAAATVPDSFDDMFEIGVINTTSSYVCYGENPAECFADAIREAGSLAGRGAHVAAMGADATEYVSANVEITVTWKTFTDTWDTFIADQVITSIVEDGINSGMRINLKIRVAQYFEDVSDFSTLADTLWLLDNGLNVSSLVGKTYNINFYSNGAFSKIKFETAKITYVKPDGTEVVVYNNGWTNATYRNMQILDGKDVKSEKLLVLFENYGTLLDSTGEAAAKMRRLIPVLTNGMGEYPQTFVGESLNTTLKYLVENGNIEPNAKTWTIDVNNTTVVCNEYTYEGNRYVRLVSANPYATNYTFDNGTTIVKNATYFFKVEPIKVILVNTVNTLSGYNGSYEGETLLMTERLLGSKRFAASGVTSWADSEIRTYLNGTFASESGLGAVAKTITVGNNVTNNYSTATSDSSGTPTSDKLFYASYYEMTRWFSSNADRKAYPTDLAKATYAQVDYNYGGTGWYYWRSAGSSASYVCAVTYGGGIYAGNVPTSTSAGVRPVFAFDYEA